MSPAGLRLASAAGLALLLAIPVAARPRWGVEFGPRFGSFTAAPATNDLSGEPNQNRTLATFGGGVLTEWPESDRISLGMALRYEESGAGLHHQVLQYFSGGAAYGLWADEKLRFRSLAVAPALRVGLGRGFGAALSPELSYVLKATRGIDLTARGAQAAAASFAPNATIFEQAGDSFELDVTRDYHRMMVGLSAAASWEHAFGGERFRIEAGYHRMLADPGRSGAADEHVQDFRAGLCWLR